MLQEFLLCFLLTKRDREGSDVKRVLKDIENSFGVVLIPSFSEEKTLLLRYFAV